MTADSSPLIVTAPFACLSPDLGRRIVMDPAFATIELATHLEACLACAVYVYGFRAFMKVDAPASPDLLARVTQRWVRRTEDPS